MRNPQATKAASAPVHARTFHGPSLPEAAYVAAWLLVLAGVTIGSSTLNGSYNATFNLPNSSAQIGADLLQAHTGQSNAVSSGAATGDVVFHVASGSLVDQKVAIESSVASIGRLSTVRAVSDRRTPCWS